MIYKLYKTIDGKDAVIGTNEDGSTTSFIFDPANTDYQAYLKFLEDGGIPEPADE
jgi:hypothetical protein